MEGWKHLEALGRESAAFEAAARACPLDAPVPSCPEWELQDLVFHLGAVHRFWGEVVALRLTDPDGVQRPERPEPSALVDWAAEQAAALHATLLAADPAAAVWTWAPQKDVAFVIRRMAHETAVHRWDAQRAAGEADAIDSELASDGIDELLNLLPVAAHGRPDHLRGSVHVHATDTPGEWLVREAEDGSLVVTAEHAKGDAALRGPASDLLLALWGRRGLGVLDVIGERAAAEGLLALAGLG